MARTEQGILIERMNQLGHLDRLFDVAEQRVTLKDDIVSVGIYGIRDDGNYDVSHPLTGGSGYTVLPRLFHGFIAMRYRELSNVSAGVGVFNPDLKFFLEICNLMVSGRGEVGGTFNLSWVVTKVGGLSRAVIINGGADMSEDGPSINWALQRFQEGSLANG